MDLLISMQVLVRRGLRVLGAHSELHRLGALDVHAYRVEGKGEGPPVVLLEN